MALPVHHEEFMDGAEAAAFIAAGVGVFSLGLVTPLGAWLVTVAGAPCELTRPLLTLVALLLWLFSWLGLQRHWKNRAQRGRSVVFVMGVLVVLGLLAGSPLTAVLWGGMKLP